MSSSSFVHSSLPSLQPTLLLPSPTPSYTPKDERATPILLLTLLIPKTQSRPVAEHDDVPVRVLDLEIIPAEGESLLLENKRDDVRDAVGCVDSERGVERLEGTGWFLGEREESHG